MDTLIEAIPTWALCYLFNSDATGLTDEEIALIDQWYTENKVMGITTATEQEGECFPYISHSPASGLPAEVVHCHGMVRCIQPVTADDYLRINIGTYERN